MAHLKCPRCHRANPSEAEYCHFDGVVLRQGAVAPAGIEFVFPSGRRCRNFDDLVQGCQYEWEDARDLVIKGAFAKFLAGVGRMDLVRSATEAQKHPDPDIGLHNFINSLPVMQVQGPRLDLSPRRINLGSVRAGDKRTLRLAVKNQGKGLLQGKIMVTEGGDWLRINEADLEGRCALKAAKDQQITLRIDTHGLPAPQGYSGKLTCITNGGIAEVPIRVDVGCIAFSRAPFIGVSNPRELAERFRTQPKQAVPLLESGDVHNWFTTNGWTYPVSGPTARGIAAVQQFFEGMGLSKPPPLELSEGGLRITCVPPEAVRAQVTLSTPVKKWVYAQAESDVPWLTILTPSVSGAQRAEVEFEVDSTLTDPGIHEGHVILQANAGQVLSLEVTLEVVPPYEPFTRRLLKPFFMGLLLGCLYRLLLAGPADLMARLAVAPRGSAPTPGTLAAWLQSPIFGDGSRLRLEFVRSFVLCSWWVGAVAGAILLWRRGNRKIDVLSGALAGAGAGVMLSATLACLLDAADALPRAVLGNVSGLLKFSDGGRVWFWTVVWLLVAAACWGLVGGTICFIVNWAGRRGVRVLAGVAAPMVWLLQICGLNRFAGLFDLGGAVG
jgi:hypothetical protein